MHADSETSFASRGCNRVDELVTKQETIQRHLANLDASLPARQCIGHLDEKAPSQGGELHKALLPATIVERFGKKAIEFALVLQECLLKWGYDARR